MCIRSAASRIDPVLATSASKSTLPGPRAMFSPYEIRIRGRKRGARDRLDFMPAATVEHPSHSAKLTGNPVLLNPAKLRRLWHSNDEVLGGGSDSFRAGGEHFFVAPDERLFVQGPHVPFDARGQHNFEPARD